MNTLKKPGAVGGQLVLFVLYPVIFVGAITVARHAVFSH